jgi:predicted CXXCH cytochrome family protein
MRRVIPLFIGLLVLPFSALPAVADECLDCHELAAISPGGTVVHPPFGEKDCGSCHADHGDEKRLFLTEEGNALCGQCHDFASAAFLWGHRRITPTGKASCTGCHDPHRAPRKKLLRAALHGPLKDGACEKCHRSDGKLLIPINRDFCFMCHQRASFARKEVHEPLRKAQCLGCHDPHGSGHARLLKAGYSLEREVQLGGKEFALCLTCHERALLLEGVARTAFTDGERNLHALHVLGRGREPDKTTTVKGLTCRNCHEAHTATTAALTRTELDCGGSLCMKMEYRRSDEGGECMTSCHSSRIKYRRTAAAAPPTP